MKNLVSKTLIFIGIIPTVIIFKVLFGRSNMLVGVTAFMAAIILMSNDYTVTPIKNTFKFILLEVFIGISAFIAALSPSLALIVTFISIFFIIYIFTYDTNKPIYMPFVLTYLFVFYFPVDKSLFSYRIYALILSGILIMFVQLCVNKNKFWTKSKTSICKSLNLLIDEIDILIQKKDSSFITQNIKLLNKQLKSLSQNLYSRKEKTFLVSDISRIYLCIVQTIEGTNIILEKFSEDSKSINICEDVLQNLKFLFLDILKYMDGKKTTSELKDELNKFIYKEDEHGYSYYISYELKQNMTLLRDILIKIENGGLSYNDKKYGISEKIKEIEIIKRKFNRNSLRFTFAFRTALMVSLSIFIVDYFNLYKGKWLVFTIASVSQPYIESSESKMLDRIKGTLIGVFIFEILFHSISSIEIKMFIGFACGYISNYFKDSSKKITFITVFALSIGATNNDFTILSFDRIKFILLGCIIAFVSNRIIFPYKIKDVTRVLISKSLNLNDSISNSIHDLNFNSFNKSNFLKIVLTNKLTNEKISVNNNTISCDKIETFLNSERIMMSNLRVFKNSITNNRIKNLDITVTCENILKYLSGNLSKDIIIKEFNNLTERDDKLIFMNIYEILKSMDDSKKAANSITSV